MEHRVLPQPTGAQPSENLGALWLEAVRAGDFAAAWRVSDLVLAERDPAGRDDPRLPYHRRWVWDGRRFDGCEVLVRCYHGLGDTLQFCRYLPALRRRVGRLTLEAPPPLVPLLSLVPGPDRIVPFRPDYPCEQSECDIEIMELAHALRSVPDPAPYLPIAREKRSGGALRVGVCWQVNSEWQPERSVPSALLTPLAAIPGVELSLLQPGAALPGVNHECPATIFDTARLIAGLDLVVTVDTMVAHLAGAIGVPVWLLLVAEPDWRWLAGGRGSPQGSPWYRKLRKYRQSRPGEWETPTAAVIADLTRLAAAGTLPLRMGL